MDEFWRTIREFPTYRVSNLGRVVNDDTDRVLHISQTKQGALKVGLVLGGRQYTRSVKVLVAEAFVQGHSERFDTPIHLDGDQTNCNAENLAWRPRWFAWKYSRQFESIDKYVGRGPVIDLNNNLIYDDIVHACIRNGFLFQELHMAIVKKIPVFPTWARFDWVRND